MDNSQRLARALSQIEPVWDETRTERAWRGFGRKRTRRTAIRVAGATAAVALLVVGGLRLLGDRDQVTTHEAPIVAVDPPSERLAPENPRDIIIHDGFTAIPEDDAEVAIARPNPREVAIDVVKGVSRFRHTRTAPGTEVALRAGSLRVTMYATEFSVARYQDVAEVWSHSGDMQVIWQGETITIGEGEHRRFDPATVPANHDDDTVDDADAPAAGDAEPEHPTKARADWRPLAREGKYEAAYRILRTQGHGNRVADLMLAADVYRMSGHPAQAVPPLERVVERHADDPRAPLAAFTLGRVLLDDLGRPAQAARAFAKARAFAPDGALSGDSLARETEAWAKAGQAAKARDRALLYLQRHPDGHRARAVKQYGGL